MAIALDRAAAAVEEAVHVQPLTPIIGAEISGVDLRQHLNAAEVEAIRAALLKHKVLFFRDQPISDEDQIRFSKYFGPITPAHPVTNGRNGLPEIKVNVESKARLRSQKFTEAERHIIQARNFRNKSRGWHTDITFVANPSNITFLRGVEIPSYGGDTLWVDLEAVYRSLSPTLQAMLEGLRAVHGRDDTAAGHPPEARQDGRSVGPFLSIHPLVRVHPETGNKSLFISPGFIKHIVGLHEHESRALLEFLIDEAIGRQDFQVRFHWTKNALAVWDNRATAHVGPVDGKHFEAERIVHRTTVGADRAVGPDGFVSESLLGDLFYVID